MAEKVKPWYLSRTIIVAVLQAILGIVTVILVEQPEIKGAGGLAILKSVLDVILRLDTKKSIK